MNLTCIKIWLKIMLMNFTASHIRVVITLGGLPVSHVCCRIKSPFLLRLRWHQDLSQFSEQVDHWSWEGGTPDLRRLRKHHHQVTSILPHWSLLPPHPHWMGSQTWHAVGLNDVWVRFWVSFCVSSRSWHRISLDSDLEGPGEIPEWLKGARSHRWSGHSLPPFWLELKKGKRSRI